MIVSDAALASICADIPAGPVPPAFASLQRLPDGGLSGDLSADQLRVALDSAEVDAGALANRVETTRESWEPARAAAHSHRSGHPERLDPVYPAENAAERAGQAVTHTATRWMRDAPAAHAEHLVKAYGADQLVEVRGV